MIEDIVEAVRVEVAVLAEVVDMGMAPVLTIRKLIIEVCLDSITITDDHHLDKDLQIIRSNKTGTEDRSQITIITNLLPRHLLHPVC